MKFPHMARSWTNVKEFISNVTTNACSQMLPESATIDSSSISLFSFAYAWIVIKKIMIACNNKRKENSTLTA